MRALPRWLLVFAAAALLTGLGYGHVLSYGLTDMDTLMNIHEGRVESAGDLVDLLGAKLTGGRARVGANFYRPVVMTTYAGLRGAFGWEPRGYHAFDLALHALNGLLLALFATAGARRVGARRPFLFGCLAGAFLVVHPVGAEVVPAVARNGDLVVTAFFLASLLALDAGWSSRGSRRAMAVAGFTGLFGLTIGSKEPGVVLLAALWIYAIALRPETSLTDRVRRAAVLTLPCLAVIAGYFALRARVLGDLFGGYGTGYTPWFMVRFVANQLGVDLLAPGYAWRIENHLPRLFDLTPGQGGPVLAALAALVAAIALLVARRLWRRGAAPFPSPLERLAGFGLAVVAVFAFVFVATGVYERRLLYPVVAFFSFAAAAALAWAIDAARGFAQSPRRAWDAAGLAAVGLLLLLLLPQTPLLHRYDEWRHSGEATRLLTEGLRSEWEELPPKARVLVVNMPSGFALDPMRRVLYSHRSSTNAPPPKSIVAWLEDQFPEKDIRVNALGLHRYREPLGGFRHRATLRRDWVSFATPDAWTDMPEVLAERDEFQTRPAAEGRTALSYAGRRAPHGAYLLLFEGIEPRFLPLALVSPNAARPGAQQ